MSRFEYKVVPAPTKAPRVRGVKAGEARFAHTIEELMNDMAARGWEFQRAETLPHEERAGLTGSTSTFRNLLVFRRISAEVLPPEGVSGGAAPVAARRLEADQPTAGKRLGPAIPNDQPAPEADTTAEDTTAEDTSADASAQDPRAPDNRGS